MSLAAGCLQLGIMLCGLIVDSTVIGGPAYNSGQLERGDVILRVDGVLATQVLPRTAKAVQKIQPLSRAAELSEKRGILASQGYRSKRR